MSKNKYRCIEVESIADIKQPLVKGTVTRNVLIASGRCKEEINKKCNNCIDFDAFGNKKCNLNGRV